MPTWPQLAPQLGAKIHPKSLQEPTKIHPNLHLVFDHLLDRFLIDFWSIFDPKIHPKSIKNRSRNQPNNTTTKKSKMFKNIVFFNGFATSAMSSYAEKSIKNVQKSITKQLSNQHPNLDRFWSQLGSILGGFWGPSWCQNRQKIDLNIKMAPRPLPRMIFNGFWTPEPFQNGAKLAPTSIQVGVLI